MLLKEFKKSINEDSDYKQADECPIWIWITDATGKKLIVEMKGFGYSDCGGKREFHITCETKNFKIN